MERERVNTERSGIPRVTRAGFVKCWARVVIEEWCTVGRGGVGLTPFAQRVSATQAGVLRISLQKCNKRNRVMSKSNETKLNGDEKR